MNLNMKLMMGAIVIQGIAGFTTSVALLRNRSNPVDIVSYKDDGSATVSASALSMSRSPTDWRNKMRGQTTSSSDQQDIADVMEGMKRRQRQVNQGSTFGPNQRVNTKNPLEWRNKMKGSQTFDEAAIEAMNKRQEKLKKSSMMVNTKTAYASPTDWRNKMKSGDAQNPTAQYERELAVEAMNKRQEKYNQSSLRLNKKTTTASPAEWRNKMRKEEAKEDISPSPTEWGSQMRNTEVTKEGEE